MADPAPLPTLILAGETASHAGRSNDAIEAWMAAVELNESSDPTEDSALASADLVRAYVGLLERRRGCPCKCIRARPVTPAHLGTHVNPVHVFPSHTSLCYTMLCPTRAGRAWSRPRSLCCFVCFVRCARSAVLLPAPLRVGSLAPLCVDPSSPPTALPLPPLPSLTAPRRSARSSRIALLLTRSARTGQLRRIAAEYEKAGAAEAVPLELRAQALKMCEDEYGLDDPRSRELELAMAGDYMRVGHVARAMALKKHVQHVEGDPARDANVEGHDKEDELLFKLENCVEDVDEAGDRLRVALLIELGDYRAGKWGDHGGGAGSYKEVREAKSEERRA